MADTAPTAALTVLAARMGKRGKKVGSVAGGFAPHLGWLVQHNPNKSLSEILVGVEPAMAANVATAELNLLTALSVGALAGRKLGIAAIRKDLRSKGLEVPTVATAQSAYSVAAEHRARERMAVALPELRAALTLAWDGVHLEHGSPVLLAKARAVAVRLAAEKWARDIGRNAELATAGMVRKSYAEVALAWATQADDEHEDLSVSKTWHATNPDPCALCAELDGTTVDVHDTFSGEHDVWWDGMSPLRHPRCGCYLSYELADSVNESVPSP